MIDQRTSERLTVPNVNTLSGLDLSDARLHDSSVTLTFSRELSTDTLHLSHVLGARPTETITLPLTGALAGQLAAVGQQGRLEVADTQGRSRRLSVSRSGVVALAQVELEIKQRTDAAKKAMSAKRRKADVRIWGAASGLTPNRTQVVALSAAPLDVKFKYSRDVKLLNLVGVDDCLELELDFDGQPILAAWDNPDEAQLLKLEEAAGAGRLRWQSILGGGNRAELLKVEIVDFEAFYAALKGFKKLRARQ